MDIEIHDWKYQPNKQHYIVQWLDLEKDEDDTTATVELEELKRHVKDEELNCMVDHPDHGDVTPLHLETWLEENTHYALKHYLESKTTSHD